MKQTFELWGMKTSSGELSLSNGAPTLFDSFNRAQECLRFYYSGNGEVIPLKVTVEDGPYLQTAQIDKRIAELQELRDRVMR